MRSEIYYLSDYGYLQFMTLQGAREAVQVMNGREAVQVMNGRETDLVKKNEFDNQEMCHIYILISPYRED